MQRFLYIVFLFTLTKSLMAQDLVQYLADPKGQPREHSADITRMVVDVAFDPPAGKVYGKVTHTFSPLRSSVDSLFWDAPSIEIHKVQVRRSSGEPWTEVRFSTNSEGLVTYFSPALVWDMSYELFIEYTATPRKGIYFIGWRCPEISDPRNQTRRQIWTQGQGIDNRHWIPMYDDMNDKFITETIVRFDERYKVLSNGKLKSEKKNGDGTKTWQYCMEKPHAGYLLMLAIGQYAVKESKTSRGTAVRFWYYPEHAEKVEPTSLYTEDMIEFLEDETGYPYPWGAYSQVMVQDFMYGAMENTSATIFGDFFNVDALGFNDRNYVSVNAHELTHQWFGDLVTARSGRGTWLQESFATYYAKLFMGHIYGPDEYAWNMRSEVESSLRAGSTDDFPVAHTRGGSTRVYPKGSTVLHMLRYVLGDEAYLRVIKYYLNQHAFGNVETNDLIQACEDVLGRNMRWFFDQWVYRGGEPHYEITRKSNSKGTDLVIRQVHPQNATVRTFDMPVRIGLYFKDGSRIERSYRIYRETEYIHIPHGTEQEIAYALFDINSQILKQVSYSKSVEELSAQFAQAEHMIDRIDALISLKKETFDQKRQLLQSRFSKEKHWSIQSEIVRQLMADGASISWLLETLKDADVRVRRVLLTEVDSIQPFLEIFRSALKDSSYLNQVAALDKLCYYSSIERDNALKLTDGMTGQNHNVRLYWLKHRILHGRQGIENADSLKVYLNELHAYTTNLYEFRTRTQAFDVLKALNELNEVSIRGMLEASIHSNRRLGQPAHETLQYFRQQESWKQKIQEVFESSGFSESDQLRMVQTKLVK